jgi:hypothetical protein
MHLSQLIILWMATMALLIDYVGVSKANGAKSQIVAFGAALVMWGAFVMNSTSFAIYSGGTEFHKSGETLPIIGVIFGFATLILLFEAVMRGFRES